MHRGVAGAVQQTPLLLIHLVSGSSFVDISLEHLHSQTVRARELKFGEKVYLPSPVTLHVSNVTRHMSYLTWHILFVTWHVSHIFYLFLFFLDKKVKLVSGVSVTNGAYHV